MQINQEKNLLDAADKMAGIALKKMLAEQQDSFLTPRASSQVLTEISSGWDLVLAGRGDWNQGEIALKPRTAWAFQLFSGLRIEAGWTLGELKKITEQGLQQRETFMYSSCFLLREKNK